MLDNRLKNFLLSYLGDFIESDELDVEFNLWSSENLRLENVKIKPSVLPSSVPFRFKVAHIGELSVQIPFSTLGEKPAKIVLKDVIIVLAPRKGDSQEEQEELETLAGEKRAYLESDLEKRQKGTINEEDSSVETEGYFGTDGFVGRLITKIIDNLQIEFRNIHIRYEGFDENMKHMSHEGRYAMGISLDSLYAESTDGNWTTSEWNNDSNDNSKNSSKQESEMSSSSASSSSPNTASNENTNIVFKLIQFMNLSLYVDPNALHLIHSSVHEKVLSATINRLKQLTDTKSIDQHWWKTKSNFHCHRFLVAPISGNVKLTMNTAAHLEQESTSPRYLAAFELTKLYSSIDDQQIALLVNIMDVISKHWIWREEIAMNRKEDEARNVNPESTAEYLKLWGTISQMKRKDMEQLKKQPSPSIWHDLIQLEKELPLESIVVLRNEGGFSENAIDISNHAREALFQMGEAFGVPLPEIHVQYKERKNVGLKIVKNASGQNVVLRVIPNGQSAVFGNIKTGFIITKINGKLLSHKQSPIDLLTQLNALEPPCIVTFRHPDSGDHNQVTLDRLVSKLTFAIPSMNIHLVSGGMRRVILGAVFKMIDIAVEGHGPGLFSYDFFSFRLEDFFIEESWSDFCRNSCLISSIRRQHKGSANLLWTDDQIQSDSVHVAINLYEAKHPGVRIDCLETYATKISCQFRGVVAVYDKKTIATLIVALDDFYKSSFPPDTTAFEEGEQESKQLEDGLDLSNPQHFFPNSFSVEDGKSSQKPTIGWNLVINVDIDKFYGYIAVPFETSNQKNSKSSRRHQDYRRESYRGILNQIMSNDHQVDMNTLQRDWSIEGAEMLSKALKVIISIQKIYRGNAARKKIIQNRYGRRNDGEMQGWLFMRDDSLAFRRWNRFFFSLDQQGFLTIYENGSGRISYESIDVCNIHRVQLAPENLSGPLGTRLCSPQSPITPTTPTSLVLFILSLDGYDIVLAAMDLSLAKEWMECIVQKRQNILNELTEEDVDTRKLTEQEYPHSMLDIQNQHHLLNFTDIYQFGTSAWLCFEAKKLKGIVSMHMSDTMDTSAANIHLKSQSLYAWDYRRFSRHGVAHIGDTFLDLKRGHLENIRYISSASEKENSFDIRLTWCGNNLQRGAFNVSRGLSLDVLLSGWIFPLEMMSLIYEVIEQFTLDINNLENESTAKLSTNENSPQYRSIATGSSSTNHLDLAAGEAQQNAGAFTLGVPHIRVSINIPMLEIYVEEENCIAKLSFENDILHYSADAHEERCDISSGPSSLFVLTKEVALRLFKISKVVLEYTLKASSTVQICLDRILAIEIGRVKFEADRRLELFFALIEVLSSNSEVNGDMDYDNYEYDSDHSDAFSSVNSVSDSDILSHQEVPARRDQQIASLPGRPLSPALDSVSLAMHPQVSSRNSSQSSGGIHHPPLYMMSDHVSYRQPPLSTNIPSRPQDIIAKAHWTSLLSFQSVLAIKDPEHRHANPTVSFDPATANSSSQYQSSNKNTNISRTRTKLYHKIIRLGIIKDVVTIRCTGVTLEIIKRSLSLAALDTYTPVMKLSFSKIHLECESNTELLEDYRISGEIEVYARYYNSNLADWEPMIEPWHVHVDTIKEMGDTGFMMNLKAMERLNINFTEALVKLILSVNKHKIREDNEPGNITAEKASALAMDSEASKESGRVCVLNNLGVPIRLANLNTSQPGSIAVDVRDGWSLPNYVRFHDVRVEIVLLPWWNQREAREMDNIRHSFRIPYGGAQAGVAPKLRVKLIARWVPGTPFLHNQKQQQDDQHQDSQPSSRTAKSPFRDDASEESVRANTSRQKDNVWFNIGSVEIDLVGKLTRSNKPSRSWYRLKNRYGVITGEMLIALQFFPQEIRPSDDVKGTTATPAVQAGNFLLFDPLRIGSSETKDPTHEMKESIPHSIRNSYVPPLALEIDMGDGITRNILCPLKRAGKFLIMGEDDILVECKIAQRDEFRRVVLLSSPVQIKNVTPLDLTVWSAPESNSIPDVVISVLKSKGKLSVPLSALYGDDQHLLWIQVANGEPTLLVSEATLTGGTHLLYCGPTNDQPWGYCFFIETIAQIRDVYREQQNVMKVRETSTSSQKYSSLSANSSTSVPIAANNIGSSAPANTSNKASPSNFNLSSGRRGCKYQIRVCPSLTFENTLPMRLQFELYTGKRALIRNGTLAPGEEFAFYEFEADAFLILRLPGLDSDWTGPINFAYCIARDGKRIQECRVTAPDPPDVRAEDLEVGFYACHSESSTLALEDTHSTEFHLFTARIDFTVADNGSPRIVIYAELWIYNQSHIPRLIFRDPEFSNLASARNTRSARKHQLKHQRLAGFTTAFQILPQRPIPTLMNSHSQSFEMASAVDDEIVYWSEKVRATTVGIQGGQTLKSVVSSTSSSRGQGGPRTHQRHDVGIAVYRPSGIFHRSTQIVITPRYVFVNHTSVEFEVRQVGGSSALSHSSCVTLLPPVNTSGPTSTTSGTTSEITPFDFDGYFSQTVCIRPRVRGAKWSGPFSVDGEREFPLRLRGVTNVFESETTATTNSELERVRVKIGSVGASIVVTLSQDVPQMFVIRNNSSFGFELRQARCHEKPDVLTSGASMAFAWDKPDGTCEVLGRFRGDGVSTTQPKKMVVGQVHRYDFEQLDRDKGAIVFWLGGNQSKLISAEVLVQGLSRALVFSDEQTRLKTKYILDVNVIALRRFPANAADDDDDEFSLSAFSPSSANNHNNNASSSAAKAGELFSCIGLVSGNQMKTTDEVTLLPHQLYRYDYEQSLYFTSRPRELFLHFYEYPESTKFHFPTVNESPYLEDLEILTPGLGEGGVRQNSTGAPLGYTRASTPVNVYPHQVDQLPRPFQHPPVHVQAGNDDQDHHHDHQTEARDDLESMDEPGIPPFPHDDLDDPYHVYHENPAPAPAPREDAAASAATMPFHHKVSGTVHIKLPKKSWARLSRGTQRSISDLQGFWWDVMASDGTVIGQVQIALKFRTSNRPEDTSSQNSIWLRVMIPSVGISFVHNTHRLEVAYLCAQRCHFLWCQKAGSNEIALAMGNVQMDNQIDGKVVLGPKVIQKRQGVRVRLRDRWKHLSHYGRRGLYDQVGETHLNAVQFRMLWNPASSAGDITHVELVELIVQELEVLTDEKFVVNLISVFQGLEHLAKPVPFDELVNQNVDYCTGMTTPESKTIYIEQLDLESVRIKFDLELNGGRHIATLGPSGRRLAVYLPESNVKNLRLVFTRLIFHHVYGPRSQIFEQLCRHYQQQAVIQILRGLHTVTLLINPFRIVYRLGHGFLTVIRDPARGLASGSPVEVLSGAYLGVRSLAVNTISASYETLAGVSGIMAFAIGSLLPEHKRQAFREDMIAFQRNVMNEVDALDAAEERGMTKIPIRQPRVFHASGIGLLTEYGPGALPKQDQERVDLRAALVIQRWWRRQVLMSALVAAAAVLRPNVDVDAKQKCILQ